MKKLLFLFSLLSAFTSIAVAQTCPTFPEDCDSYNTIPWNDGGCYQTNIDGCVLEICYCYRTIDNVTYEYSIRSIEHIDGTCPTDWDEVIRKAGRNISYVTNPAQFNFNDCSQPIGWTNVVTILEVTCWKLVNVGTPTNPRGRIEVCSYSGGCCEKIYTVCETSSGTFLYYASSVGTSGNCLEQPSGDWEYNVCYEIDDCNY